MTLMVTDSEKRFNGSDSTGPFTWTWRFLSNDDIKVYKIAEPNADATLEVLEELGVGDYTLTGAGTYTGGSLTLAVALPVGQDLLIQRETEITQEVNIRDQGGNFRPETHEEVFDRLTMMIQDQSRRNAQNELELSLLKTRMLTAETSIISHHGRLDSHDTQLLNHEGRISTLEGVATNHEGRIDVLESQATHVTIAAGSAEAVSHIAATVGLTIVNLPAFGVVAVRKTDASANFVRLVPGVGHTVMGGEYVELKWQDEFIRLAFDGVSNWGRIG